MTWFGERRSDPRHRSRYTALSSAATPRHEIGRRAGEAMLDIIRHSGQRPADRIIDLGSRIKQHHGIRRRDAASSSGNIAYAVSEFVTSKDRKLG